MRAAILRGAEAVLTMDDNDRILKGDDVLIRGGLIQDIGPNLYADDADFFQLQGMVVTPGLVNTHHHLFQTMTRAVPGAQDASLFGWLQKLYPIWSRLTPAHIHMSAIVGLAELALSGVSLTSDHLYLFPNGAKLDDTIDAALETGIRFQATRGSMSIGESQGGLPPDTLVEAESSLLNDCIRVVERFHDRKDGAMTRVSLAPCSPFSVSRDLMRETASLARDKGVMLHTHLAENDEDIRYSLEKFGCRPGQYAEDLGWTGSDVWHAHCVKLDASEIDLFARTRTGTSHCPCSNCRLGSGIAPLRALLDAKVPTGLGVDGSASNDRANLMAEARMAMLLQRVSHGAGAFSAYEALKLATRGGAQVLGRTDCGQIAHGKRADIAIWDVSGLESAGSWDPAALVLAGPDVVRHLFVEGRQVIRDGWITTIDLPAMLTEHARLVRALQT